MTDRSSVGTITIIARGHFGVRGSWHVPMCHPP